MSRNEIRAGQHVGKNNQIAHEVVDFHDDSPSGVFNQKSKLVSKLKWISLWPAVLHAQEDFVGVSGPPAISRQKFCHPEPREPQRRRKRTRRTSVLVDIMTKWVAHSKFRVLYES